MSNSLNPKKVQHFGSKLFAEVRRRQQKLPLVGKELNTCTIKVFSCFKADQIRLNESTIRDMQVSLKLLLEENRKLKNARESEEYEKLVHLR